MVTVTNLSCVPFSRPRVSRLHSARRFAPANPDVLASTRLIAWLARKGLLSPESDQRRGLDRLGVGRGSRCMPVAHGASSGDSPRSRTGRPHVDRRLHGGRRVSMLLGPKDSRAVEGTRHRPSSTALRRDPSARACTRGGGPGAGARAQACAIRIAHDAVGRRARRGALLRACHQQAAQAFHHGPECEMGLPVALDHGVGVDVAHQGLLHRLVRTRRECHRQFGV